MKFFFDPRIFNIAIIVMFFLAAFRWAVARNWPQTCYWIAAAVLNIAVTFMATQGEAS